MLRHHGCILLGVAAEPTSASSATSNSSVSPSPSSARRSFACVRPSTVATQGSRPARRGRGRRPGAPTSPCRSPIRPMRSTRRASRSIISRRSPPKGRTSRCRSRHRCRRCRHARAAWTRRAARAARVQLEIGDGRDSRAAHRCAEVPSPRSAPSARTKSPSFAGGMAIAVPIRRNVRMPRSKSSCSTIAAIGAAHAERGGGHPPTAARACDGAQAAVLRARMCTSLRCSAMRSMRAGSPTRIAASPTSSWRQPMYQALSSSWSHLTPHLLDARQARSARRPRCRPLTAAAGRLALKRAPRGSRRQTYRRRRSGRLRHRLGWNDELRAALR